MPTNPYFLIAILCMVFILTACGGEVQLATLPDKNSLPVLQFCEPPDIRHQHGTTKPHCERTIDARQGRKQ